jgi:Protein of unknown function DUF2625
MIRKMPQPSRFKFLILFLLLIPGDLVRAQASAKPVEELINRTDPGWTVVLDWIKQATNKVEVLPRDSVAAVDALYFVQVTTRSPMGAIVYETGGLLIDHGWIRVLGSGSARLNRSLPAWNKRKTFEEYGEHTPYYLVADDVLGGFFAINGGGLGDDVGKVYYLSPDGLDWEPMHYSYSEFLNFCFSGPLDKFYNGFRWEGWEKEVDSLSGERAYSFMPPLWSKEGKDIRKDSRKNVAVDELYRLIFEIKKQRELVKPGNK